MHKLLVPCVSVEYFWSERNQAPLRENSLLCGNPNSAGAPLSGVLLLQRRSALLEPPSFVITATSRGNSAPERSSSGVFVPRGNPGLKYTRTDANLKKIEFKINMKRDLKNFRSIQ
jgi:hypothetical protein